MTEIDGYNSDIKSEQLQKLAELFPEAVSEGKVNFDMLRATLGDDIEVGEKYGLGWKGKSGVFAKIQEKTVSTLHPQPNESVDWDTTQNMFIEGDNLEALKVLHKAYYGKIKMIYIDPPYNTGNDFVYNDDFAKTRRQNAMDEGLLDEEGNATRDDGLRINTGGHKHSNWLDMMYPRLFLARNLLRQDGVIFVSIDDNEVHNLRVMMNEIFGEENFVTQFIWRNKKGGGNDAKHIAIEHEYILTYARSKDNLDNLFFNYDEKYLERYREEDKDGKYYWDTFARKTGKQFYSIKAPDETIIDKDPKGNPISWLRSEARFKQDLADGEVRIVEVKGKWSVQFKQRLPEGKKPRSILTEFGSTSDGSAAVIDLFGVDVFSNPKPPKLIAHFVDILTKDDDIIMDFFSGSGTTAESVWQANKSDSGQRKWILIQLQEDLDKNLQSASQGERIIIQNAIKMLDGIKAPHLITEVSKERIRRVANKHYPEVGADTGFRVYSIGDSNLKKWNEFTSEPGEIRQATFDQLDPIEDSASDHDLLTEVLLKRGISPLVEAEVHEDFIFIPAENLAISLSRHLTEELFDQILATKPSQIILLDQAFRDNVNLKTNLILQAEKQDTIVESI